MRIRIQLAPHPAPLLLFVFALAAAAVLLIGPIRVRPAFVPPVFEPSPTPVMPAPQAEPVHVRKRFPGPIAERDVERLRRELDAAEADARSRLKALQTSSADLEAIQAQIDALRAEIASLEAKRTALGPIRPTDPAETNELTAVVDQRRKEVAILEADLARAEAPKPQPGGENSRLSQASAPVGKLPVPVELIHNQIAPVTPQFFHFPSTRSATFVATRTRRGETIEEARNPDSLFGNFLSKFRRNREYILLLVNPDSFDAFYAVRELALKAGVEISWQPSDTSDGAIPIVHVVAASKHHPGVIKLPDIVQ